MTSRRRTARSVAGAVLMLTVAQLVVGTFGGLQQFEDKAFGYRLAVYPLLMTAAPVGWWFVARRREAVADPPWPAFVLMMAPFLFDVTGNTLDLYDSFDHWDNLAHFITWLLLMWGAGLLIVPASDRPRWLVLLLVTGSGTLLALGWEVGEWFTFIRGGVELEGAYEDTLSDQVLGTLGAFVAATILSRNTAADAAAELPASR